MSCALKNLYIHWIYNRLRHAMPAMQVLIYEESYWLLAT
jgi:hypothetical protein